MKDPEGVASAIFGAVVIAALHQLVAIGSSIPTSSPDLCFASSSPASKGADSVQRLGRRGRRSGVSVAMRKSPLVAS